MHTLEGKTDVGPVQTIVVEPSNRFPSSTANKHILLDLSSYGLTGLLNEILYLVVEVVVLLVLVVLVLSGQSWCLLVEVVTLLSRELVW